MCWIYQMISWSFLLSFGPLLLELVSENPCYPWWTTSLRWGGCSNYLGPWSSPAMLWTPCPTPTHSSWSWEWWGVVYVEVLPHHFLIGFSRNVYPIHPFFNLQVGFRDIMFELRHIHFFSLYLMSEYPAHVSGLHHFYNDKEHFRSIVLGVEVVCRPEIPQLALWISGQTIIDTKA